MHNSILILLFVSLTGCGIFAPASPTRAPSPQPSATARPPTLGIKPTLARPTSVPDTPGASSNFDAALRPEFRADLNLVQSPTVYQIQLQIDPSLTRLTGQETVTFTNRENNTLSEVYFRLFPNNPEYGTGVDLSHISVDGAPVQTTLESRNTALRVPLGKSLAPGSSARFDLAFSLTVPISGTGHYSDFTNAEGITTLPTVYPLIPAYDEAGWHLELPPEYGDLVYADASIYDVRFTAPTTTTVIASGSAVETTRSGNSTVWHFIGAPMRDFHIDVSAILQKSSAEIGDVTLNSYYLPGDAAAGQDVLRWATAAFQAYERHIGPYPFRELDIVETPTTAGGIEYPGLVAIASNLYRDSKQRDFFEFATVHEVAHQWWYSVVGDDQVNTPWMDESLVQHTILYYAQDAKGGRAADDIRSRYFQALYENARRKNEDKPVGLPVSAYTEDQYGEIVYGKGPLFFDAVRQQLGDLEYEKFLQTYYRRFKYQIAKPDDLVRTIQEVSGQDIRPLYDKWILGK